MDEKKLSLKDIAALGLIMGIAAIVIGVGSSVKSEVNPIELNETLEMVQWLPMIPFLVSGAMFLWVVLVFYEV